MEVGKTIRSLRSASGMSQEELAGKVFVSRQTISNWENDKSYPDVQSLALIAALFGTSIDALVKGDLPMIDARIAEDDIRMFRRNALLYGSLLVVSVVVMAISLAQGNWLALATGAIVYALSLYFAFLVEHDKKKYDVHTYREIRAFCDGVSVDEIKARRGLAREGAGLVWKIFIGAIAGAAVGLLIAGLTRLFSVA